MKKSKKEPEGKYILTLVGLIGQEPADALEMYLRRFYAKEGHPAIVLDLDENKFIFTSVDKQKK